MGFAAPEQRKEYALDLFGLRWEALDEDLSYDGFFYDKMNKSSIGEIFKKLYGINVTLNPNPFPTKPTFILKSWEQNLSRAEISEIVLKEIIKNNY